MAVPEATYKLALLIDPQMRYLRIGTPVGRFKGKDIMPDPALALSTIIRADLPYVEVDCSEALKYLKKEAPEVTASPGWQLLRYQGLNLGWIKVLKNRVNNYYPKEWRIRMSF